MSKRSWKRKLGPFLGAGLLLAGCAHTEATPTATTDQTAQAEAATTEADPASDELRDHHRHHHHGGVAMFIEMSLDTLNVNDDQKAQIEKIKDDLHAKLAPARDAEHGVLQVVADGVAAGKIDEAKADAAVAQLATATDGVHAASADALNQLHAVLTPEERTALVEKVQAHWEVWRQVNHEQKWSGKEKGSHLAKLTEYLSLTPDQQDQVAKALDARPAADEHGGAQAVQAHLDAFAKAFASDTFDAKTLTTAGAANGHIARFGAERTVHFYEVLVPILTPEQRTKLSEKLSHRLNDNHHAQKGA